MFYFLISPRDKRSIHQEKRITGQNVARPQMLVRLRDWNNMEDGQYTYTEVPLSCIKKIYGNTTWIGTRPLKWHSAKRGGGDESIRHWFLDQQLAHGEDR